MKGSFFFFFFREKRCGVGGEMGNTEQPPIKPQMQALPEARIPQRRQGNNIRQHRVEEKEGETRTKREKTTTRQSCGCGNRCISDTAGAWP